MCGKLMFKWSYTQRHCRSQHWCPDRETRHEPATNVHEHQVHRTFRNNLSDCIALYYWPVLLPAPILQLSLTERRTWLGKDCQRNKHETINSNVLDVNSWYQQGDRFRFQDCYRNPPHVTFINTAELIVPETKESAHRLDGQTIRYMHISSNTTIYSAVCYLLYVKHNWMFRPQMLAIFRLYNENLSISYKYVCRGCIGCREGE
jgi:hypothetical protein